MFDVTNWTQGVLDLYLGRASEDQVLALLQQQPSAVNKTNPVCTAPFYIGEYELARGSVEQSRTFFQQTASSNCLQGEVEAAYEELGRLPK